MTPEEVARFVGSEHRAFGERNWVLLQSGRERECEEFDHLCDRLLKGLADIPCPLTFSGLLLMFSTPAVVLHHDLVAELLWRGKFRSTVPVATFLDAVLCCGAYPSSTDRMADYMAWAFGRAEALAATRARRAKDQQNAYYLESIEYALASDGQHQP
jgi:hypothetical protein